MLTLPSHSRYAYSPIVKRPDYSWPGGKRLAFYIAINIEHFAFGAGWAPIRSAAARKTTRNYAWRDYGKRIGAWRLFDMLDQLKLPATILLNSSVCDHYPDIIEKIRARGDDVVGHGRTTAEVHRSMWEHDEARVIAEMTEVIAKHIGMRPTGWMGPGAAEIQSHARSPQGGGLYPSSRLAGRRPADLDADACRAAAVGALSDGIERPGALRARDHTGRRVRRYDRRSVRRDGRAVGAPAAGLGGVAARLHRRPAFRLRPLRQAIKHCVEHKLKDRVWCTLRVISRNTVLRCRRTQFLAPERSLIVVLFNAVGGLS